MTERERTEDRHGTQEGGSPADRELDRKLVISPVTVAVVAVAAVAVLFILAVLFLG